LIAKNTALITVANRSLTYVDLEVNEEYAANLSVGQKIEVTVGSTAFNATITQIGKTAAMSSDGLTATVSVRTKPVDNVTLTPGASAVATLSLGEKEKALTLPRGAWLTTGNQKYVFKIEGNKAYKTEITVGEIQGTKVEILTGLKKGDVVITSGYQDYLASESIELK
jgi:RND family efflux transporter MFP subunit